MYFVVQTRPNDLFNMLTSSAANSLFSRLKLPMGLTLLLKVAIPTSIEAN
jgi:hypothetical protein